MAIAPPSDIVMDVVNAADPAKLQEAQARLQSTSATLAASRLTQEGKGFSTDVASLDNAAGLRDAPRVSSQALRLWVVLGPLVFIGVGGLGSWLAGSFLGYPQGYAKLMIVAVELALLPSLTLILGLLIMGAPKRENGR